MARYEITGTATDVYSLAEIQDVLAQAGARSVRKRLAFGWSNQPKVATFWAIDDSEAEEVCLEARRLLGGGSLPLLIPWKYQS